VRIWVKIGGCAGMAYKMEYTESVEPDRRGMVEGKGVRHLVGPKAVLFLLAPRRTCKVGKLAAQFVFNTPTKPSPAARESVALTPGKEKACCCGS
jgi:iron-sulfur cluster assembly protein